MTAAVGMETPSALIAVRGSQIFDHGNVLTRDALDELARARAQVHDRTLGGHLDQTPVGTEVHPAFKTVDRQFMGGHRDVIMSSRTLTTLSNERKPPRYRRSVRMWRVITIAPSDRRRHR